MKNELPAYFKIFFSVFVKHFLKHYWDAPSGAPACSPSSNNCKIRSSGANKKQNSSSNVFQKARVISKVAIIIQTFIIIIHGMFLCLNLVLILALSNGNPRIVWKKPPSDQFWDESHDAISKDLPDFPRHLEEQSNIEAKGAVGNS